MASQEEVSFRCKMCQFMANSKVDIADHFMEIHAAVEVVDTNAPNSSAPSQSKSPEKSKTGDIDISAIKKEVTAIKEVKKPQTKVKTASRSKPGFRGNAIRSTISHLVRAAEQQAQGTSKSRVKPSVTVKFVGKTSNIVDRELRQHKKKRKFDDFVMYNDDDIVIAKTAKLSTDSNENGTQVPTPRPRSKSQVRKRELAEKISKIKVKDFKVLTLSISGQEFTAKVEEHLQIWLDKWNEKNNSKAAKCDHENCGLELDQSQMLLHKQCHIKNYYGFRCPHCDFMHSRWRNMKCHVYNLHKGRQLLKCDWAGCTEAFTILAGLKRHMQRDHIQQKLIKEYTPGLEQSKDTQDGEEQVGEKQVGEKQGGKVQDGEKQDDEGQVGEEQVGEEQVGETQDGEKQDGEEQQVGEKQGGEEQDAGKQDGGEQDCETQDDETQDDETQVQEAQDDETQVQETQHDETQVEAKPAKGALNVTKQQLTKVDGHVIRKKSKKKKKEREEITLKDLKKRKRRFEPLPWRPTCSVCEMKYIALDKLDDHLEQHVVPEEEEKVKCTECGIVTDNRSSLKAHMQKCHPRMLKVYRCDQCKYAGDRQFDFQKHLITHCDTKPCMCEVCGKLMSTVYNLKVHRLRVHATDAEKTIHCQHCTYRCANIIVLKDHMRFQHNLMWNGDCYKSDEKLRRYKCDLCSYVGRKESSLQFHMRVHTENRQFPCNLCAYASKTKNNLFLHMRTHGGMKPVKCPQCEYRGATNKVVNEHVLSKHSCLRPYRCPCGWSTSYSGNMWKHVQMHREKDDGYRSVAMKMYGSPKMKKGELKQGQVKEESPSNDTVIATIVQDLEGVEHREELQLNNLAEAVCMAADKGNLQHGGGQDASHLQTTQAANFLSKLAHAVSTGQVDKQMPEQTTEGADQTIEDLVLW
ncbi:uncharacterized protein [Asterias amurensis]|uniref:uncharacterized protein isoform X2 n=1 Tax=Asterias amurensis TaxID=7602 RepID=UPI003AB3EB81